MMCPWFHLHLSCMTDTFIQLRNVLVSSARVVSYKRLRGGVEFMAEIPRSAAGKILRKQLRLIAREPNVDPHVFSAAMMLDE